MTPWKHMCPEVWQKWLQQGRAWMERGCGRLGRRNAISSFQGCPVYRRLLTAHICWVLRLCEALDVNHLWSPQCWHDHPTFPWENRLCTSSCSHAGCRASKSEQLTLLSRHPSCRALHSTLLGLGLISTEKSEVLCRLPSLQMHTFENPEWTGNTQVAALSCSHTVGWASVLCMYLGQWPLSDTAPGKPLCWECPFLPQHFLGPVAKVTEPLSSRAGYKPGLCESRVRELLTITTESVFHTKSQNK